jgi:phosphoglycerol transferase MdoB-like AlkP superfamily enzyme
MDVNKIRKFCRVFRITIGLVLIAIGFIIDNAWFYLGVIPLIAGLTNFCPLCMITKKCDLPEPKESSNESN